MLLATSLSAVHRETEKEEKKLDERILPRIMSSHACPARRAHRACVTPSLVLLLLCVLWSVSLVSAIDFHLLSSEHSVSTADGAHATPQHVIAADGGAQHCFLVEMDTEARRGAVSFTYDSNVSITDVRSQLFVSTHLPSTSTMGLAVLDSVDSIVEVTLLTPYELRKYNDVADAKEKQLAEAEATRLAKDSTAVPASVPFDRTAARLITVKFNAATSPAPSGGVRVKSGSYAICFSLDARRLVRPSSTKKLIERVTIGLVEVSTSKQVQLKAGGQRLRRPRGSGALRRVEGLPDEAWTDPKALLQRELEAIASSRTFSDDDDDDLLTSDELDIKLRSLKQCWRELRDILSETDRLFERFGRMRKTAESTFTRVWVCTLFVILVCVVVVWFTFRYTKKTIVKRKLI